MILMIDNYDSFTFNIVQYLQQLGEKVVTFRNDEIDIATLLKPDWTHLVISPGPGTPENAGISLSAIKLLAGKLPILGICLGHQAIAMAFGGQIKRANPVMHGKTSIIEHDHRGVFKNVPSPMRVTRYHSLYVEEKTLPIVLEVSARTSQTDITPNMVMGIRHRYWPVNGFQFHPEALLSENGLALLKNFLHQSVRSTQAVSMCKAAR